MPPQVGDAMPWRRKLWIGRVFAERDRAQQAEAERQEREADRSQVDAEHARKMASMGRNPDGTKLGS